MDQVHVLRHKVLVEGRSVRQVAREMRLSRNTVRRYLATDVAVAERKPSRRPAPVRELVSAKLGALLADSPRWTGGKQRVTATRLHRMLLDDGVQVGETVVKEIVREWRRQRQEVFVPLVYTAGDLAEVDFFEVLVDVAGKRRKAWMFVMRLMHSGRDFAWLYPRQDQVCFLDGHVRAFRHFGAVPQRCLYDNLRAAVARILVGSERKLAARFEALVAHYVFEPCFARPRTGHDKGGVESRGRAIRRQHLVPIPAGETVDDVSEMLLARLEAAVGGEAGAARFAEERAHMLPLPAVEFRAAAARICAVSRRSLVKVDGAVYSVPCEWAGLDVTVYAGVADVEVVGPGGGRARHVRQPFGGRSVDYLHYLPELARKPSAVRQVAHELVPRLGSPFDETWARLVDEHGPRDAARVFARVLRAVVDMGAAAVADRLRRAQEEGTPLPLALAPVPVPSPTLDDSALPASLQQIDVAAGRAADYDLLLGGAA